MPRLMISKFNTEDVESKIAAFEKKYKFRFPEEYRKFLLKYNGGYTVNTEINYIVASDLTGLYSFDGSAGDFYYLNGYNSEMIENHLEEKMMPIGSNCFGDYFTIGISKKYNGQIFFYYHDRPPRYIRITDSFKEFVNVCVSREIGHIRTIEERKQCLAEKGQEITPGLLEDWQKEIDFYSGIHQEEVILD